eukprot:g1406.t1
MSHMMQPPIILLKDGTDTSQGKGQLISNINACEAIANVVKTTLGPRGMDKLIHINGNATISNDGAEIMNLLDIVHPAGRAMVDIAKSQDAMIGDGTTTVVLIAGELMKNAKSFIEENMHPMVIVKGYRLARDFVTKAIKQYSVGMDDKLSDGRRLMLERCAGTSLNSKLISAHKHFFAPMVVDAVTSLDDALDLKMIGIKKVPGGSVTDSFLVQGVAFKKTFAYAGFEQQPKKFSNPKVLLLNVELELKSEKENAEIRLDDPSKYQSIVDAEWQIIYDKLACCVASGAKVILSRLPIGDLATQYFADRGLFCAGRVHDDDMQRTARATGARMQTSVQDLNNGILGTCESFKEVVLGDERYNIFEGCPQASTATIVLRGGAEQFIEESHRSIHDAICIVKRSIQSTRIVAGGGAIEMELSKELKRYADTIEGKLQTVVTAFAKSLEVIPRQLSDNAGFDSTDIVNKLRKKHFQDPENGKWYGVDIDNEGICNTFEKYVWEPESSKINSITAATEAACIVLSVDETVRNPRSEAQPNKPAGRPGLAGAQGYGMGGKPALSAGMGGGGLKGLANMLAGGKGPNIPGMKTFKGRGGR